MQLMTEGSSGSLGFRAGCRGGSVMTWQGIEGVLACAQQPIRGGLGYLAAHDSLSHPGELAGHAGRHAGVPPIC